MFSLFREGGRVGGGEVEGAREGGRYVGREGRIGRSREREGRYIGIASNASF